LHHHERFWRLALAFGYLLEAASRGNGSILLQNVVLLTFLCIFIAMLDQEPVGAIAAIAVVAHAHQHPASLQLVAIEAELEIALLETRGGIDRFPIAAIPQLHRAAAILPLRDRAFEIAIVERMVFGLD